MIWRTRKIEFEDDPEVTRFFIPVKLRKGARMGEGVLMLCWWIDSKYFSALEETPGTPPDAIECSWNNPKAEVLWQFMTPEERNSFIDKQIGDFLAARKTRAALSKAFKKHCWVPGALLAPFVLPIDAAAGLSLLGCAAAVYAGFLFLRLEKKSSS
jgi:hypothetical protein